MEIVQGQSEEYFKLVTEMKKAVLDTTNGYLKTGDILERLFNSKLYKYSGFDTWEDFVTDVCGMSVSGADHIRRVTRTFGITIEKQVNFSRLLEMVPIVNDDNMEVLLEKAGREDSRTWKNTMGLERGRPDQDKCLHENQITRILCKDCGKWL